MKIYFLSSTPCLLTLNGVYFGITDKFERFADIHLTDRIYASFFPENANPLGFFLTENLLTSPPAGCEVYLLRDGVAVYAKEFSPNDLTLQTISQERLDDTLVTLFKQGGLYISVQTPSNFFVAPLPPSFCNATVRIYENIMFVEGQNALILYSKSGEKLFEEEIIAYSVDKNTFNATLPLSDRLGRIAECSYQLSENACVRTNFSLRQDRAQDGSDDKEKIADEILAYAFFESVLIGAEYREFLCEELLPSAGEIVGFLGNFKSVILTENPKVCGLVLEKSPRLYEVFYYETETNSGKIIDIKRV